MSEDPLASLITNYHELNAPVVDELSGEPSPLEFVRYVAQNRPWVARGVAAEWPAVRNWNAEYLRQRLSGKQIRVAVTPRGNADAVVEQTNGELLFVQPHEISREFGHFLDYIQEDSRLSPQKIEGRTVQYAQTQNDNLREEYQVLYSDVPSEISFAQIGLDRDADAVNFWLGNHRSVTALHKDNYENIYVQVRGQKHFVLLPPISTPCVNEQDLSSAHYTPSSSLSNTDEDHVCGDLAIKVDEAQDPVPIPTWDPDYPDYRSTVYSSLAQPLRVTLNEGDMLYLPAMWFHKVSQSIGEENFSLAVNYWYDMDFSGGFWAANSFLRDVTNTSRHAIPYPTLTIGHEDGDEIDV